MTAEALPLFDTTVATFDVSAVAIPAQSFTGDFYYVERCHEGLWFALGDVAGKGLNASVMMMMIQEELENAIAVARRGSGDPAAAVWRLDRAMQGLLPSNRFATVAIGRIDRDGTLVIANAGHCPPLVVSADGIESIGSTGPVIGILPRPEWKSTVRQLRPGDTLVLYSDGVVEASDRNGAEFGSEQLMRVVRSVEGVHEITAAIARAVEAHAGKQRQDDLTAVAIRLSL